MATNKKKKKGIAQPQMQMSPEKYIKEICRKLPIYECRVGNPMAGQGLAQVVVSRLRPNGNIILGFYLLDTWCLGLKNTMYRFNLTPDDYEEVIDKMSGGTSIDFNKVDSNYAHNLIYGAIEYAEDLGIQPHKDFKLTEYILNDAGTIEFEEIEFGKNGKPFYIAGPFDNSELIIKKLTQHAGIGNFDYIHEIGGDNQIHFKDKPDAQYDDEDWDEEDE